MRMSKQWCIAQCRFYKGEDECPAILKERGGVWSSAWFMENLWVREMTHRGYIPTIYSEQYSAAGLNDFNRNDGVHIDLKEFLYGYGLHRSEGMMTADEFKRWYDYEYLPKGNYYKEEKDRLTMATKEQLLVFTKYYKGEDNCPAKIRAKKNGAFLWQYEQDWVNDSLNHRLDGGYITEYITYVGDKVPADVGYPISLLAYLFHCIGKWSYSLESCANGFYDFLKEYYLN